MEVCPRTWYKAFNVYLRIEFLILTLLAHHLQRTMATASNSATSAKALYSSNGEPMQQFLADTRRSAANKLHGLNLEQKVSNNPVMKKSGWSNLLTASRCHCSLQQTFGGQKPYLSTASQPSRRRTVQTGPVVPCLLAGPRYVVE